ncbi:MarC family protein [Taibaiella soli]|uniref:UPF0056 membrane protein n=1 Tax=Taibaiella soli TaxID=1649169 RepID=A0A2W2ACV9_9BACT|nr:MarC family protein [Taibaiella soli]
MALFPPVNPISDALIVNRYLTGLSERERKLVVWRITRNCMLVGIISLILGHLVLQLFNLAIPVIQLAGGILICKAGFEGLQDSEAESEHKKSGNRVADGGTFAKIENKIFYPLSFPICLGPGTISVIFTLMASLPSKRDNMVELALSYGVIILAVIILCALIYICCLQGQKLMERLGESGGVVITKLVSFLTFCVGIQIAVTGISKIFHLNIL